MSYSILFVDDDQNLLKGISRILTFERSDISFDTASSGEEALKLLEKVKYDIIVSDQHMAGMTGITLLSFVRAKYPEIKRVMLSAQVNEDVYHEAETIAHKYISKPCDTFNMISEIENFCNLKKME
jgi:DNA-binding NtrC family response regulator